MADEIDARVSNLKIMTEEDSIISLDDVEGDAIDQNISLALVGKVLTTGSYNFEALR